METFNKDQLIELKNKECEVLCQFHKGLSTDFVSVKQTSWKLLCKEYGFKSKVIGLVFEKLRKGGFVEILGQRSQTRYRRLNDLKREEAIQIIDSIHQLNEYIKNPIISFKKGKVSRIKKESVALIESNKEISITPPIISKTQFEFGKKYFFVHENLIGYGILKTIEAVFNKEETQIEFYRYEVRHKGRSYVVRQLFESINSIFVNSNFLNG